MTTSSDNAEDLNYDCNYNLFLAKTLLDNLKSQRDRQLTLRWLRKLTSSNRSIAEMKLRNDFMYHLVLNLYAGKLQPPFDSNPPHGPLPAIVQLLPQAGSTQTSGKDSYQGQYTSQDIPGGSSEKQKFDRPMVDQSSPDGGAFLSSQPIPKCGAFCYLAVVAKPKSPKFENKPTSTTTRSTIHSTFSSISKTTGFL